MFNFYTFELNQVEDKGSLFAIDPEPDKQRNYKTPLECFGSFFATNSHSPSACIEVKGIGSREGVFKRELQV